MQHYDSKDSKFSRKLRKGAPDDFSAFVEFDQQVFAEEGHTLSKKTRELIAIGVAATTQCPHCIEIHSRGAARRVRPKKSCRRPLWWRWLCAPAER